MQNYYHPQPLNMRYPRPRKIIYNRLNDKQCKFKDKSLYLWKRIIHETHDNCNNDVLCNAELHCKCLSYAIDVSEILVQKGLIVKEGDTIGKTGNSGNASNMLEKDQHLHFELRTQPESKKGLDGKKNPNIIVDTKFESQDPNAEYQNQQGVVKMTLDGKKVNMNIDLK